MGLLTLNLAKATLSKLVELLARVGLTLGSNMLESVSIPLSPPQNTPNYLFQVTAGMFSIMDRS